MTPTLPAFPPLLAPGLWWSMYLEARIDSKSRRDAIATANASGHFRSRDWMRIRLKEGMVLTVPVAGGASALKNHDPATWTTAPEALREGRKMMATLATLYGKTPFAASMLDMLEESLILIAQGPVEASEICTHCFCSVESFLGLDSQYLLHTIRDEIKNGNQVVRREKEYRQRRNDPSQSIAVTLMKEGPDAIFTLLPPF